MKNTTDVLQMKALLRLIQPYITRWKRAEDLILLNDLQKGSFIFIGLGVKSDYNFCWTSTTVTSYKIMVNVKKHKKRRVIKSVNTLNYARNDINVSHHKLLVATVKESSISETRECIKLRKVTFYCFFFTIPKKSYFFSQNLRCLTLKLKVNAD